MAGLIPRRFIDDLLERIDIVDLIDNRVKLRKTGHNYSALCPFHQEKTPSFSVNPNKQFYYCFGCSASGNALTFLMEYERLTFPEAIELLAHYAGMEIPQETVFSDAEKKRQPSYELLHDISRFYQQQLRQHDENQLAIDYLKQRGLSGEIAKLFTIGYAPSGWDNVLKKFRHIDQQQLLNSGMVIRNDNGKLYDRFRQRIMFPIRDGRGRVIAFGGRVLGDDKPKYLNSPETDVFHKGRELYGLYEMRKAHTKFDSVIVVEGYMDVIALAQHDIRQVVATLGTAISQIHLERLFRMVAEIIICFDGDLAGQQAAQRALEIALPIMSDGRQIRFLFLAKGEDPDSVVRAEKKEGFVQRVEQAVHLPEFFFSLHSEKLDLQSMEGRARLSSIAMPLIKRIPAGVLRQLMLEQLATLTGLEDKSLLMQHEHADKNNIKAVSVNKPNKKKVHKGDMLSPACFIIQLLLGEPSLVNSLPDLLELTSSNDKDLILLLQLVTILKKQPDISFNTLLNYWEDGEIRSLLMQIANQECHVPTANQQEELAAALARIKELEQNNILERLLAKAKQTTLSDDEKNHLMALLNSEKE